MDHKAKKEKDQFSAFADAMSQQQQQLKPMVEQLQKMLQQKPITVVERKEIKINGKKAAVSLTSNGAIAIEFASMSEAKKFYDKQK